MLWQMNVDVLQRIFEFAGVEERYVMRTVFGEIFRYPRVRSVDISIQPVEVHDWISGGLLRAPFCSRAYIPYLTDRDRVFAYSVSNKRYSYTRVYGSYRVEKTLCFFCGQERVETFIGEHGMYANKSLGSVCIYPWTLRQACNKPRSRGFG
jgi:hypothetical protein